MSRGHGRIQLQVLEYLLRFDEDERARGQYGSYAAVLDIAGRDASRSRLESVRRAVKSLGDEGLIRLQYRDAQRATSYRGAAGRIGRDYVLMARLASEADDQEQLTAS
jgi:hypothetical protein